MKKIVLLQRMMNLSCAAIMKKNQFLKEFCDWNVALILLMNRNFLLESKLKTRVTLLFFSFLQLSHVVYRLKFV